MSLASLRSIANRPLAARRFVTISVQVVIMGLAPTFAFAKGAITGIGIALIAVAVVAFAAVAVMAAVVVAAAVPAGLVGVLGAPAVITASNLFPVMLAVGVTGLAASTVNTIGTAMCLAGTDSPTNTGCGGGGSSRAGGGSGTAASSGVGAVGACQAGYYLCGGKSWVPFGNVCCASVGQAEKYCPSGYTCKADGTCQLGGSAAAAPTSSFNASSGGNTASAGGTLNVGVGTAVTLSWTSSGATSCALDQGVGGVNASGTVDIECKQGGDTPITLSCTGEGGETKKTITLSCVSIPKIKEIIPE